MIGYLSSWYTDCNWLSDYKDAGFGCFCDLFCFFFVSSMWILPVTTPPLLCVQVRINSKLISSPLPSWFVVFHPERCTPEVWPHCCNYSFVTTWNGPQHGLIVSPSDKAHSLSLILSCLTVTHCLWQRAMLPTLLCGWKIHKTKWFPETSIHSVHKIVWQTKGLHQIGGEKKKTTSRSPHSSSEHPLSSWEWGWVECVQDKITHQNGIA